MDAIYNRWMGLRHDEQSVLSVLLLVVVALSLGWMMRTSHLNQTRLVAKDGLTAEIPQDWVLDDGDGKVFLQAWNKLAGNQRFQISMIPVQEGSTLQNASIQRNLSRGQALSNYRVVDTAEVSVAERMAYEIAFAYVDLGARGEVPHVIEGVDYYFWHGADEVMVLTMETEGHDMSELQPQFEAFMQSVLQGGE